MNIAIVLGTRPEIIKLSPIINKLNKKNSTIIFTGQHYDFELSKKFINELKIRKPDYWLKIGRDNAANQIGQIMIKLSKILKKSDPDCLLVQGDTNTVLAGGLTALKNKIPVCHVEAGLRSYDWRMPEEHNRIEIDHISELLFAPTQYNKKILMAEKVHGKIHVTGNTVVDAINHFALISSKKSSLTLPKNEYILMTLHRTENVDNKKVLTEIVRTILTSNEKFVFPVHPHTRKRLHQYGLYQKLKRSSNIRLIQAVGYFDMIELMKKCSFIVTDSGGLQEEATAPKIRKKVLVLRKTTDRPEAVKFGMSVLVGTKPGKIMKAIHAATSDPKIPSKKTPYGTGNSSQKILQIIKKSF